MTRPIDSGVAAVATLVVFAHFSAVDAGSFKRSRAKAAQAGKFKAARRSVQRRHRTARNLSSGRRTQASPSQAAVNQALAIYVRKCLDNILPECPK